jgi:hypothetical protein
MEILSESHRRRIRLARSITYKIPAGSMRVIKDPIRFSESDSIAVGVIIPIAGRKFLATTQAPLDIMDHPGIDIHFIENARTALFKELSNRVPEAALSPSRLPL